MNTEELLLRAYEKAREERIKASSNHSENVIQTALGLVQKKLDTYNLRYPSLDVCLTDIEGITSQLGEQVAKRLQCMGINARFSYSPADEYPYSRTYYTITIEL